jgi:hypothetical protein
MSGLKRKYLTEQLDYGKYLYWIVFLYTIDTILCKYIFNYCSKANISICKWLIQN